ncbi:CDP-alcohol phosphatidyltransferase family protein [Acidithiobacillus ferrooxidans]|uniref:CDP-alcohol phosphatidyltransferase family protein n=1 Tax=Acidithiobacillus ferrooxidans TaxID=920 RepID=UPI001F2E4D10|nr:CDP-alcohol phosphatidyltransferase family protein [Acidithiobacillus ferrooxidans]
MNLPNLLTLLRLFLVPVIFYALARGFFAVALVIFFAAAITDALDGWIARHYHLQTRLGAVLDPVADKLLVVTTVITLTWLQRIPLWLTVAVISRDLLIVGGGLLYLLLIGKFSIHPTLLSKWNTALQFVVIVLVLLEASSRWQMPLLPVLSWYSLRPLHRGAICLGLESQGHCPGQGFRPIMMGNRQRILPWVCRRPQHWRDITPVPTRRHCTQC